MGFKNLDEVDAEDVDPRDAFLKLDDEAIFDRRNFVYFQGQKETGFVLSERNNLYEVMFSDGSYKAMSANRYDTRLATADEISLFVDLSIENRFMDFEEEFPCE